jgi:DNA-binding PadR family transcriptional regulator
MGDQETEKAPKTELIMTHIAKHGPETEYDLYKQLPNLSHGTIHYCLKKLTDDFVLKCSPSKSAKSRPKKLYQLTFLGTILHLTALVNVLLPWLKSEATEKQMDNFRERFDDGLQVEIVDFLEKQGRLLKYAPFQEVRWLLDHYPGIVAMFLVIADTICLNPPFPYKKPFSVMLFRAMREDDGLKERTKREEKDFLQLEDEAFRDQFTDLFFQSLFHMKAKGETNNNKLRQLAKEYLEDKRDEARHIEYAIKLFSKRK